jgi:hypothetical protein
MPKKSILKCLGILSLCAFICVKIYPITYHDQNEDKTCWFDLMLDGKKTGYFSFRQYSEASGSEKFILREEETFMRFKRSLHIITSHTKSWQKMDESGKLINFQYQADQENSSHEIKGNFNYQEGFITITFLRDGNQRIEKIEIIKDALTEYQAMFQLKERGWLKGDSLTYSNFMIEIGSYIKVNMKVVKTQPQELAGESKNLFQVERTIENMPGIRSITWVDSNLIPYKGELIFPDMKYTLKPTSKENAVSMADDTPVSLNLARIPLKNTGEWIFRLELGKIKKTTLFLKLKEGEPFVHDLAGGVQRITNGNLKDGLTLIIETHIPKKIKKMPITGHNELLASFLSPNFYVESNDEKIVQLSEKLKVKNSAWQTAINIKNWVYGNILMTFKTGFGSALQTLNSGEGDCTEHALLTAALCRANGIPTRAAIGYTLSLDSYEMPYYIGHMWNEIFIGGIWIPLDSTSPDFLVDPFRIRLFSTNLETKEIMKTTALISISKNLEISLVALFPNVMKEQ